MDSRPSKSLKSSIGVKMSMNLQIGLKDQKVFKWAHKFISSRSLKIHQLGSKDQEVC